MDIQRKNIIIGLTIFFILLPLNLYGNTPCSFKGEGASLARKLGWIRDANISICKGFYREIPAPQIPSLFKPQEGDSYHLQAHQIIYSLKDPSMFEGKYIHLIQQDKELTSDFARVYLDRKSGDVESVDVKGNIRVIEPGKLLLADEGNINFSKKRIMLKNVLYRIAPDSTDSKLIKVKKGRLERRFYQLSAWGKAKMAKKDSSGVIDLQHATYTTCPPANCAWVLSAGRILLDPKAERGYAVDTRLLIKGVPILYFPYFNFPLSRERQSGFLIPSYHFSSQSGAGFLIPYYFNIAPNYDATVTPNIITRRGVLLNGSFRYLTENSQGTLGVGWIPLDSEFKKFKKEALTKYSDRPTLGELRNASNSRYSVSLKNHTEFNPHLVGDIRYNYVSDYYYLQDFRTNSIDNSDNQLLRQVQLDYSGKFWNFLANFQDYQTLHPVNQGDVNNQYSRLPQLQLNGNLPQWAFGLDYILKSEIVHFTKKQDPWSEIKPVIGTRLNLRPSVSLPLYWPFAYLTPELQVQMTKYRVEYDRPEDMSVVIPMFDVKAGIYLDRYVKWLKKNYRQTLEPMVYYLYVPYRDQDRFPYFDTTKQTFDYDFMFQDNRFIGIDRIGDANRASIGLATNFIDAKTGTRKASAKIGQIRYFQNRKVTLCSGDDCQPNTVDEREDSPIAASAVYNFNPNWNVNIGLTVEPRHLNLYNRNVSFQYLPDQNHIFNVSYNFMREGGIPDGIDNELDDLKQTDISGYWQFNNNWSFMGRWNYNWSHKHSQAYFYGFVYESCCWAMRFMGTRTYVGLDPQSRDKFDNAIYIQFALKGLGNIGNNDPKSLLTESISGYVDHFGKESLIR